MPSLRNPQKQIPGGGFDFRQPEINWSARKSLGLHPSIDTVARALISARKAHPHLVAKHHWATDFNTVRSEVIAYAVKICIAMGWTDFITDSGGGDAPPTQSRSPQEEKRLSVAAAAAKKLWSGLKTVSEWLDSNEPAVPKEQSEARAAVCVACPFNNSKSDFSEMFVTVAASAIKRQLEKAQSRKLFTSLDNQLGICAEKDGPGGCLCANRLSVHVPIKIKVAHMAPEVLSGLHDSFWVKSETAVAA